MKMLVAGIAACFLANAVSIAGAQEATTPAGTLSPARSLIGTWKTPFYVKFRYKMDSSRFVFEDVATEMRKVTWVITKGLDANTVNIYQTYGYGTITYLDPDRKVRPDRLASPYLYGKISGTRLIVWNFSGEKCGTFNFTTDLMGGTWDHRTKVGMYLVDRLYTKTNALKLVKQP